LNNDNKLLVTSNKLIVINVGLFEFSQSLQDQDIEVIHVDWVPPAGGDKELSALLDEIL